MEKLNNKLQSLKEKIDSGKPVRIALFGLGSVGRYLLDYLMSLADSNIEIIVAGWSIDKQERSVNILKTAATIRHVMRSKVIQLKVDLKDVGQITKIFKKTQPDLVVNTSRVYSNLKYGTISWHNLRAYGIWTPLSVKYIHNIMRAHTQANSNAIVVNTSYPDATNALLKSAGIAHPDFGSGNVNHLIPRIKFVISRANQIENYNEIDVTIATGHFHDVCISMDGVTDGVDPLIHIEHRGKEIAFDVKDLCAKCAIPMPSDQSRNMMNASSNFEMIRKILDAIVNKKKVVFHSPGVVGEVGGYPVYVDFSDGATKHVGFFDKYFSLDEMRNHNRMSMNLDGLADITHGTFMYTDKLVNKVKRVFNVDLPKKWSLDDVEKMASFLIDKIITPSVSATQ